ncbi:MAG: IPT/TIG domain-containing protein [Candidatus Dormibacteria bacterium]
MHSPTRAIARRRSLALLLLLGLLTVAVAQVGGREPAPPVPAHPGPASSPPASTLAAPVQRPHAVPCLDLPISSALISATSCWQVGVTQFAVAGSSPNQPTTGAVAEISGQAQSLHLVRGSGPLRILGASSQTACIRSAANSYRVLNLGSGKLGSATQGGCRQGPVGSTSQPGVTTARLLADPTVRAQAAALPPQASPSYYEYQSYLGQCTSGPVSSCPLYQQGQATYPPSPAGLLVLDFGAPCYLTTATSEYGAQMFGGSVCVPDATISTLVSDWIAGYESDHGAGTTNITVAAGTSNSLNGVDPGYSLNNTQMQASGQAWYQQAVAATPTANLAAPVTLWGASDMEQSNSGNWYAGTPTVAWVQGYSSASPAKYSCSLSQSGFLADYGDDVLGGSGSADGWTVSQVYQVAWAIPATCALPEIYYSGMAAEWAALSQWGSQNSSLGAIIFSGVMTEAVSGSYSPTQGWDQLQQATSQSPPIPTLTNIGTSLQGQPPQVDTVSPNQGPVAGGTQVIVTGANLLGAQAVYFGPNSSPNFTVDSATEITATAPPGQAGFVDVSVETTLGASPPQGLDGFVYSGAAAYTPLVPARVEDTRTGSGLPGSGQPPGPGGTITIQVAGEGGVPASGVQAVLINLTVVGPTQAGYVTAYPAGVTLPLASTVDFQAGVTKANLALVTLGRGGAISLFNAFGTTQVVVDVEGWYAATAQTSGAGLLNSVYPQRIVDTRPKSGHPYAGQALGPGQSLTVQVAGVGGIPASGAQSVVMNMTETGATAASFLTVFPAGSAQPQASNLNFLAGQTAANQVVMELGSSGQVTIYNHAGTVNVILDVAGWYGSSGTSLATVVPARAVDTRSGSGQAYAGKTLGKDQLLTVDLGGLAGIPTSGVTAVAINVTVTNTTAAGALLVGPGGQAVPSTSEVNWSKGQTSENLVIMAVGPSASINLYNLSLGSTDVVIDVYGWYG